MSSGGPKPRPWLVFALLVVALGLLGAFGPVVFGQDEAKREPVDIEAMKASHTPDSVTDSESCAGCHESHDTAQEQFALSVHARPDKVAGDHPNCVSCHMPSGKPEDIEPVANWTRKETTLMCAQCHSNTERMERYSVDTDAVPSYHESFHGKALLRFGQDNSAGCVDCHKSHEVYPDDHPKSPTSEQNIQALCQKCHAGAHMNFAMSGANHLRLKVKDTPVLRWETLFFQVLIFGVIAFLGLGVALDLRKRVFSKDHEPRSGRPAGLLIGISFLFMVATLALATLRREEGAYTWAAALVTLALAFVAYWLKPKQPLPAGMEKRYPRWPPAFRWQHALMGIAMLVLIVTGLPQRFAHIEWVNIVFVPFGGFPGARIAHRAAAIVLIVVWLWHLVHLLVRWKRHNWSMEALTMMPTMQDVRDFVALSKYYVGITKEEPKFGKYGFKNKLDYLAEYWGMPVMVLSGLVLWFPIALGSRLPNSAFGFAYIAHGYEATLAFLSILTWHMYNAHLNPDSFPMQTSFMTGTMTRDHMEREHGRELERLDAEERATGGGSDEQGPPSGALDQP